MFLKHPQDGFRPAAPGIHIRTLAYGEKSLMCEFHLAAGSRLPCHTHPHEQTGYLVSGRIRLTIGGAVFDVDPGDSWCIPGSLEHSAEILVDSVAVEVFSPVREDYLPG